MKRVDKAWGTEEWLVNEPEDRLKRMRLNQGAFCSIHRHPVKKETFVVETGVVRLELEVMGRVTTLTLQPGAVITISRGRWHRFSGVEPSMFLEASTHHDDGDVERLSHSGGSGRLPPWPEEIPGGTNIRYGKRDTTRPASGIGVGEGGAASVPKGGDPDTGP